MNIMRRTDSRLTSVDYTDAGQLGIAATILPEIPATRDDAQKRTSAGS